MKLALIQERQNRLYAFHDEALRFSAQEVAALQANMLDRNIALLRRAGEAGADMALTSEAINFPGRPAWHAESQRALIAQSQDEFAARISKVARDYSMMVVAGLMREVEGQLYNAAVVFDGTGKQVFCYRKQFLAGDEAAYLTPGKGFPIFESPFGRIGIGICWDMQFPEVARAYAKRGADLVLAPTWGWERVYAAARAYENGIYVASAMAVPCDAPLDGRRRIPSQVIAPDGRVLAEGRLDGEDVVLCTFDPRDCADMRMFRMDCLRTWEKRQHCPECSPVQ